MDKCCIDKLITNSVRFQFERTDLTDEAIKSNRQILNLKGLIDKIVKSSKALTHHSTFIEGR